MKTNHLILSESQSFPWSCVRCSPFWNLRPLASAPGHSQGHIIWLQTWSASPSFHSFLPNTKFPQGNWCFRTLMLSSSTHHVQSWHSTNTRNTLISRAHPPFKSTLIYPHSPLTSLTAPLWLSFLTLRPLLWQSQLLALSSLPFIHQLCPFENPSKLTVSTTQTVFPVSRAKPCAKVHPQITSYSLYNNAKEGIVNSMFKQWKLSMKSWNKLPKITQLISDGDKFGI